MFNYRVRCSQNNTMATIQQIEENPGILVEQLSPLVISSTTWRIIQQINLEPLTQQGEKLLDNWRALTQFYKTSSNNSQRQQQFKNIYKQINDCNQDMERVFELMKGHRQQGQHRERRAWFSAVGKVSKVRNLG